MVPGSIPVSTSKINRRLKRTIHKYTFGIFEQVFGGVRNSPYRPEDFFDLFITAAKNREDGMANEASKVLNLRARKQGLRARYWRGRRIRSDGTYSDSADFASDKHCPSSKTLLTRIKKGFEICEGTLVTRFNKHRQRINALDRENTKILERAKESIRPLSSLTGVAVALDFHDQDFYGQPNADVTIGYGKNTKLVYRFCSSRVLSENGEFCTRPLLTSSTTQAIEESHREYQQLGINDKTYLGDRGFCGVKEIKTFQRLHLDYLTPVHSGKLDKSTYERIQNAAREDHVTMFPYSMGKTLKEPARTFIVVVPFALQYHTAKKNTKHTKRRDAMVFSTSLKPETNKPEDVDSFGTVLSRIYRLRFGIETDWALLKSFRPLTTSPDGIVRLFYFYMGIILYNIWF